MTIHHVVRKQAILVGLLASLAVACGKDSTATPGPAVETGKGGSKAGGAGGGAATGAGGSTSTPGAGGATVGQGGAPGAGGSGQGGNNPDPTPVDATPPVDMMVVEDTAPADVSPTCTNPCTIGRKRCGGDRIEECAMVGNCPLWQQGASCMAPQTCMTSGNTAMCACPTKCTKGQKRCGSNNTKVEECTQGANDACTTWTEIATCATPMACVTTGNNASCSCPGACAVGAKRCQSADVQECKAGAAGTCPTWQTVRNCDGNLECYDPPGNDKADCRCKGTCTKDEKRCNNGVLQTCINNGPNNCGQFNDTACPGGAMCVPGDQTPGRQTATCACPLTVNSCVQGESRCNNGTFQACRMVRGCWEYVNDPCELNKVCNPTNQTPGKQSAVCVCKTDGNNCMAGERRCITGGAEVCDVTVTGACGTWKKDDTCKAPPMVCKDTNTAPGSRKAECTLTCPSPCKIDDVKCDGEKLLKCQMVDGCATFKQVNCDANRTCQVVAGKAQCECKVKCDVNEAAKCGEGADAGKILKCVQDGTCQKVNVTATCTSAQTCKPKGTGVPNAICCAKECTPTCITSGSPARSVHRECKANADGCVVLVPEAEGKVCAKGCRADAVGCVP